MAACHLTCHYCQSAGHWQEKKKGVPKVAPMAFGRRIGEAGEQSPRLSLCPATSCRPHLNSHSHAQTCRRQLETQHKAINNAVKPFQLVQLCSGCLSLSVAVTACSAMQWLSASDCCCTNTAAGSAAALRLNRQLTEGQLQGSCADLDTSYTGSKAECCQHFVSCQLCHLPHQKCSL